MLAIRREQLRIVARETLADRLVAHAHATAPAVCATVTADHLHAMVEYCLDRCALHGFTRDYDALRYLNLMLVFGVTFDQDQPWATTALAHPNPKARMELLMDLGLLSPRPPAGNEHG